MHCFDTSMDTSKKLPDVLIQGQPYLDAYANALKHGTKDCESKDQCGHIKKFLKILGPHVLATPGTEEWKQSRTKYFTASPCAVLLPPTSIYYGRGHMSTSRFSLIHRRAAAIAKISHGVDIEVKEDVPHNLHMMQHGLKMEALAIWVIDQVISSFPEYEIHGISHVPCCRHPELPDTLVFTPDYMVCLKSLVTNKCSFLLVEVKCPYSRKYDEMQPTPLWLYPQLATCATGLGIPKAALLQMWGDRAMFHPLSTQTIVDVWTEVKAAVLQAEHEAKLTAQTLAYQRIQLISRDPIDSRPSEPALPESPASQPMDLS